MKKKKTDQELSAEQKAFVRKVVSDPALFATHVLGADLWQREAEILRSIRTHRRTAVKACHGVGKTFTLAVAALWCGCGNLHKVSWCGCRNLHKIVFRLPQPYKIRWGVRGQDPLVVRTVRATGRRYGRSA